MARGHPMTDEQKAAMREGRQRKARERREQGIVVPPYASVIKNEDFETRIEPSSENTDVFRIPSPEPRLDDLLTDAEIQEIRIEARKKALQQQKEERRRAYAAQALADAKLEIGATPADEAFADDMKEPTRIFVEMPRLRKPTGGELPPEPIIIDQNIYTSGRWYTVPKGQAIYMRYLMDQAIKHVNQVDGRSRSFYNVGSWQVEWQGGAASGGGLRPAFDALHKRPA